MEIIKARAKFEKKQQLVWFYPTLSGMFFNFARNILAYAILIKKVLDGSMDIATFTLYLGLLEGFTNWIYTLSQRFNDLRKSSHEFNDCNQLVIKLKATEILSCVRLLSRFVFLATSK